MNPLLACVSHPATSACLAGLIWIVSPALAVALSPQAAESTNQEPRMKYAIAIHGGAGPSSKKASDEANRERIESMRQSLDLGKGILEKGGSSVDAVEAVVAFLEDDPKYNAGKGAVFTIDGEHELDASIMDGRTGACGAVAGVRRVKNPIKLARLVMTESPHVLLAGAGAERFAALHSMEMVDNTYFDTPETKAKWEDRKRQKLDSPQTRIQIEDVGYFGTVGCVALDLEGNLAAATSTGGMTAKMFGRVGDSPIIGAGTYAENGACAVSCTGKGEEFIRRVVAYDIAAQMRYGGRSLEESVRHVLRSTLKPNDGGVIAVDHRGNITMDFTTPGMARAAADASGRHEVLWIEDDQSAADR
jgi:beta-aspartyl-peptidase (threonine type)